MGEADDRVGYGRPPRATQFKPGRSGNPSGRPRRKPTIDDFVRKLLDGPTTLINDGREVTISGREAVARTYFKHALKGDRDALKKLDAVDQGDAGDHIEDQEEISPEDVEIVEACAEQPADTSSGDPEPEPLALAKTKSDGSEDADSGR